MDDYMKLSFPRAGLDAQQNGWAIDPSFLRAIASHDECDGQVSMETIESVLLALKGIGD